MMAIAGPGWAQLRCPVRASSFNAVENPKFRRWLNAFAPKARAKGVSTSVIQRAFASAGFLPDVVARDRSQFQTRRTLEDYLSIATSEARLTLGAKMLRQHGSALARIEREYGVDRHIVAAIWGMESKFGERRGDVPVISAVGTLAFDGRRRALYEKQLIAALQILDAGDVELRQFTGSWAGAMGHTQFIPTSFLSFAVDFTGDGRRNIWGDDPTDALASTAAYLARNGWKSGVPWGGETGHTSARGDIVRPQAGGPRFTTTRNFRVLLRYNNSKNYALSVGHLADRLRGGAPIRGAFPADQFGLVKTDRIELQRQLTRRGFDLGDIDGVIGDKTRCSIHAFQRRAGLPADATPSRELLRILN